MYSNKKCRVFSGYKLVIGSSRSDNNEAVIGWTGNSSRVSHEMPSLSTEMTPQLYYLQNVFTVKNNFHHFLRPPDWSIETLSSL
ncbi:hypothetical protein J6590_021457 [Homalodisca vitripennis]|nr:hypothetical protein J6590_021457 [Homalodisca vitripennis]